MLFGVTLGALGLAAFAAAPVGAVFLIGVPLIALWGLGGAAEQAIMSSKVPADAQGRLQGATTSLIAMAGMIAPLMYTRLFSHVLRHPELPAGAPYMLASSLLVIAILVLAYVSRGEPKHLPRSDHSTG